MAEAHLEAADKEAKAKMRMAEGVQAEAAAKGLAEVEVKEADAVAIEKVGLAEVRVKEADAEATEKVGLAEVRVKQADVDAEERMQLIEAKVLKEKGLAEAEAIREKLKGEAEGLTDKAEAMKVLDEASREHEEYRLRLEMEKDVALAHVDAHRQVAEVQAGVLSTGLQNAKIDIVGGESAFFDRVVGAIGMGKAIDGFVDRSDTSQKLLGDYLQGDGKFTDDLKDVLTRPAVSSADVRNLTLASFLTEMAGKSEGDKQVKLEQLQEVVERMGIDDVKLSTLFKS